MWFEHVFTMSFHHCAAGRDRWTIGPRGVAMACPFARVIPIGSAQSWHCVPIRTSSFSMAWNATASQAQFAKYHRRFRRVTTNGVATAENGNAMRIRWVPGTNRTCRAVSSHCKISTACPRPRRNRFMICSTTGGTEKSRKWSKTYFRTCCPRSVERISIGLSPPRGYVMGPMNVAERARLYLVLEHLEFVPVGVREPEDRPPVLFLDRVRDLDALLAESGLLLHGVRRGEHESRVPFLRAGVGAELEVDVRASRSDRGPMRERGHDPETELLLPPLHRPLLVPYDDRHCREFEHGPRTRRREISLRSRTHCTRSSWIDQSQSPLSDGTRTSPCFFRHR